MKNNKATLILMLILLTAIGLKVGILLAEKIPFNSDEAVVGLMAKHILQGERPIFFYGQAYMGSLDAYLVAIGFAIFGIQVWVIRLVQILLYLGTLLVTYQIAARFLHSKSIGLFACAILAIPPVNVTLYTTASLGGYGEALLIGNLQILVGFSLGEKICKEKMRREFWAESLLLGFLIGLGLWANGLTLIYALPVCIYLLWQSVRHTRHKTFLLWAGLCGTGFILGSYPWWNYAVNYGINALLGELVGKAVAVETTSFFQRSLEHFGSLLLLGSTVIFGFRPPWDITWLGLPLIPFILLFWGGTIYHLVYELKTTSDTRNVHWVLLGVLLLLSGAFVFSSFGVDPSGRYFLPFAVPMAVFAGTMLQNRIKNEQVKIGLLIILLCFHLWGTIQSIGRNTPGITTQFYEPSRIDHQYDQELIKFLREQNETRGYSNYWVSYPIAFLSDEELIFLPRLPYHQDMRYTSRDDRYPPYSAMVESSLKIAYISTKNPELDEYLMMRFQELGIQWQEKIIGDYRIYYQLSKAVHPDEIGLGKTHP